MPLGMGMPAPLGKSAGALGENAGLLSDNAININDLKESGRHPFGRRPVVVIALDAQPGAFGSASKSAAEWRSGSCSQGSPQLRLTLRPRVTAGRASMRFAQASTCL